MISSVSIHGFRRFKALEVPGLARVNLFVGRNNVGKSSLLEAIGILAAPSPYAAWRAARRRGEVIDEIPAIYGLMPGFVMDAARGFTLIGKNGEGSIRCSLKLADPAADDEAASWTAVVDRGQRGAEPVPVGEKGEVLNLNWSRSWNRDRREGVRVNMLSVGRASTEELAQLLSEVVLTDDEQSVVDAMRVVEPTVERVAPHIPHHGVADVRVRLAGHSEPAPLASMGEGSNRMLALSLSLAASRGGYLLLDEIDTGLHHSVMGRVWRLVLESARSLEVQVFATTHSEDCWRALGELEDADAALFRLEDGGVVEYGAKALAAAARNDIEVR